MYLVFAMTQCDKDNANVWHLYIKGNKEQFDLSELLLTQQI